MNALPFILFSCCAAQLNCRWRIQMLLVYSPAFTLYFLPSLLNLVQNIIAKFLQNTPIFFLYHSVSGTLLRNILTMASIVVFIQMLHG